MGCGEAGFSVGPDYMQHSKEAGKPDSKDRYLQKKRPFYGNIVHHYSIHTSSYHEYDPDSRGPKSSIPLAENPHIQEKDKTWKRPIPIWEGRSGQRCSTSHQDWRDVLCSCNTSSRSLKAGVYAKWSPKNTFLSNTITLHCHPAASKAATLHTVLACSRTFTGVGVKTGPTLKRQTHPKTDPGRNLGKADES